jgi:hypothetical protein
VTKDDDVYEPGRVLEYAGKWTFILSPEDMDELAFLFQEEWGYEPNGHSWGAVIETLVRIHSPELVPLLHFGAEGDECWVTYSRPEPLETIAQMLRKFLLHPEELWEALQKAEPD